MPGGISNPVVGYVAFCAIKVCGYSLAARFISRSYAYEGRSAWTIGAARTGVGMIAGGLYYSAILFVSPHLPREVGWLYLAGFLPIRILEWWLLLWLFYDRRLEHQAKGWRIVALATLWSYVVDIPAVAGMFVTGGMWIC
jgi:hypothetical protein